MDKKQRNALIVVDMQEAFFQSDGPLRQDYIQGPVKDSLISTINTHIEENVQDYWLIVFIWADYVANELAKPVQVFRTKFPHRSSSLPTLQEPNSGLDLPVEQTAVVIYDTHGEPTPRCVRHISKHYHSSFKGTLLDLLLRRNDITHLTLAGVTTSTCITATALDAVDHGYIVNIPPELTAARTPDARSRAISNLSQIVARPPTRQLYVVNGSIPSWRCQLLMWEIGNLLNPSQRTLSSTATTQTAAPPSSEAGDEDMPTPSPDSPPRQDYNGRPGHDIDNLNFQTIRMRIMNDNPETRTPEFIALNSRGQTPVYVQRSSSKVASDRDSSPRVIMAESRAICQYLTQQHFCSNDKRARVAQHLGWLTPLDLQRAYESDRIITLVDDLEDAVFKGDTRVDINQTRKRLQEEEMPIWEGYLKQMNLPEKTKRDSSDSRDYRYMGGSTSFTYADCFFYPILAFIVKRGFPITAKNKWPYLRDYYRRCTEERLSCQRSMPVGWHPWKAGQSIF